MTTRGLQFCSSIFPFNTSSLNLFAFVWIKIERCPHSPTIHIYVVDIVSFLFFRMCSMPHFSKHPNLMSFNQICHLTYHSRLRNLLFPCQGRFHSNIPVLETFLGDITFFGMYYSTLEIMFYDFQGQQISIYIVYMLKYS